MPVVMEELIKLYFSIGFSDNKEILVILAQSHQIIPKHQDFEKTLQENWALDALLTSQRPLERRNVAL